MTDTAPVIDNAELQSVAQLELQLLEPGFRSDPSFLDAMIADDFVECGASGRVFGKDVVLRDLPQETDDIVFVARDLMVTALGPDVAQTVFTVHKDTADGEVSSHRTSLWRRNTAEPGWQVFYHQGTRLAANFQ